MPQPARVARSAARWPMAIRPPRLRLSPSRSGRPWSIGKGMRPGKEARVGFHEVNARRSDFAFASAAAQIVVDEEGICRRLALGIGAVTPVPLRLDRLAEALIGTRLEEKRVRELARAALAEIEPLSDLHASADYRPRAPATLRVRAIAEAYRSARGQASRAH